MKPGIKNLTKIILGSFLGLTLFVGGWISYTLQRHNEINEIIKTTNTWDREVVELMILTSELMYFPSPKRNEHWKKKQQRLLLLIDSFSSTTVDREKVYAIAGVLRKLPDTIEKFLSNTTSRQTKKQYILSVQSKVQFMVLTSALISRHAVEQSKERLNQTRWIFISIFILYLLILMLFIIFFKHWVKDPVDQLISDISKIGKGDFSTPLIRIKNEELQLIADAINSAKKELLRITVNRDELEQEMFKRRDAEERYRILADYSLAWDYWLSPDNHFIYVSPACETMSGYVAQDFYDRPELMEQLIHPEDKNLWQHHEQAEKTPDSPVEHKKLEFRIFDKNNKQHWIQHQCRPIYDESHKYLGNRGVNRDISIEKQLQMENADFQNNLEKKIHQRTRELEHAFKDLEGFSYSVSHDLRAPLRAIDGFVNILTEDYAPKLDKEGLRLLTIVSDNAKKMGDLIDDILAFSRAGRLELEIKAVDMNELVSEVWGSLQSAENQDRVQFQQTDLPEIQGDVRALRQVWFNLISNAIKFTSKRHLAIIDVKAETLEDSIRYCVSDNGAGFNPAYTNKLFVLFQRLHGMDEFEGTGVGLAIVKRFIQKHGGTVEVEGILDKGATFCFILPK